jgi:hypothetical protein
MSIQFNRVAWYSKLATVIFLIAVIFFGIYVRGEYKKIMFLRASVSPSSLSVKDVSPNGDVALVVGSSAIFDGLQISLDKIVQDSRCPADVACVRFGFVTAQVTMHSSGKVEEINLVSDGALYRFANYTVSIIRVAPTRYSKMEINPEKYTIVFHVANVLGT